MSRPRIGKELRKTVTFQIEPSLKAELVEEAERSGISLSRQGAIAIRVYLKACKQHRGMVEWVKAQKNRN